MSRFVLWSETRVLIYPLSVDKCRDTTKVMVYDRARKKEYHFNVIKFYTGEN